VLNVLVPEVVLQSPCVVAIIGELKTTGMAQHVWVDRAGGRQIAGARMFYAAAHDRPSARHACAETTSLVPPPIAVPALMPNGALDGEPGEGQVPLRGNIDVASDRSAGGICTTNRGLVA